MRSLIITALIFTISLNTSITVWAQSDFLNLIQSNKDYSSVKIDEVYSADSFRLLDGEKIRLIGLNAPAVDIRRKEPVERDKHGFPIKRPIDPASPIEEQSYNFVVQLLEKQMVRLEFDHNKKDENLFTLAYAFLEDGTFVNEEILRQGFANLQISPVNKKYNDKLRNAYKEARQEMRGLQSY